MILTILFDSIFVLLEPLDDILSVIEEAKPNFAILVGPFVDLKNSSTTNSDKSFTRQWIEFAKVIAAKVKDLETTVVLGTILNLSKIYLILIF